ncbi:RadC family protein [Methylophaga sulfidovorans]|uniref:DNA replication and repair protein RadC n=1 Tax=Methylophaga sulfidovorans TaxID=45496 RepID=A0A1I3Y279_9GAMM|nr:DNA repair protein RadC [Methylophaga sulfidovorans]SFK25948.1 DNA replication and repair protein RadC [Methylophaga sulfidovorans]
MAIKDWPADDRPREKLLLSGAKALSDAELLAIFLRTGVKGFSAVDLARKLIDEFGSLRQLLEADQQQFCKGHGLGQAKYVQLQAVLEMGRRHLESSLKHGDAFTDADNTMRYIKQRLRAYPHEVFACLYLDNQHRFLQFDELFRGTIDGASVYPREVVKAALKHNAAAVILAHNHPSGVAEPSQADIHITKRIKSALDLVDIRVLDHIIVGDAEVTSLAQRGCL